MCQEDRDMALVWVARLANDQASDEDFRDFHLWVGVNSGREQAFDEALQLWRDIGSACASESAVF